MKSILLTSTALVAFAGAAAADGHTSISHALSGKLGFNTENNAGEAGENGFYWEGNLKTTASATLDNGITAGAYFEITIADDNGAVTDDGGNALTSSDFLLSLTSDTASLYFGDTGPAAAKHWASAGDMESDGFTTDTTAAILRGDMTIAGFDASISAIADDATNEATQLSVGAKGSFGAFTIAAAYQQEASAAYAAAETEGDFNASEIYGISVGATFAGATVTAAYAENLTADTNSVGVKLAYPFGPVTATAYYVVETGAGGAELDPNYGVNVKYDANGIVVTADYQDDQGTAKYVIDASYDLGNGLTALAGVMNENEGDDVDFYVGASYDLGGGAKVLGVYAADEDGDQGDEIGAGEYDPGFTVEVSFAF